MFRRLKPSRRKLFFVVLLALVWLFCSGAAWAGPLSDRLAQFPQWQGKPPGQRAEGDLAYPTWMAGTWRMRTTLVDLVAPLAPEIVSPGFEGNRQYLDQPVDCLIKFVPAAPRRLPRGLPQPLAKPSQMVPEIVPKIVSDRAYNGLSLARAYLGDQAVKAVKVDPDNPNRQITLLRGDRQLESTVTTRATESPSPDKFITSEVFQQVFRGTAQPFLNVVENTTAYTRLDNPREADTAIAGAQAQFIADQVTAIYLSPQDPDYFKTLDFKTRDRPVALYRYRLSFAPPDADAPSTDQSTSQPTDQPTGQLTGQS